MNESASKARPLDAAQLLTFMVGGDEYGVPILAVKEIVQFAELTRMPQMPATFRGVANLRGSVVPVIDLGVHFGTGEIEATRWACIVIVDVHIEDETSTVGLLVDEVRQVLELNPDTLLPAPTFGTRIRCDLLHGLIPNDNRFVQYVDQDRLLSPEELLGMAAAVETLAPAAWEGPLREEDGGTVPRERSE